eukprot:CAMPEP_0202867786 /NCGR_PEP_ID=MMETSP1391-20130828/9621_1 /ASSEMBLY_ACC=CAM_ASM_000867 /TAXON_ID=1034604 /ORGANISM="Chlamydomonas leiostraca, Strain SAG 11-49" /LENGTH=313 /DNA_ID=CAMNT_0049547851 /DNA_START=81 /DNA_END=1019 /DNA_ORIENTATION=+
MAYQYPKLPEEYVAEKPAGDGLPCKEAHQLKGHEGPVLAVRFNVPGTYCLSCGKDRNICLWNPSRGVLVKTYAGHGYEVRDVSVSKDNSKFASVGGDKQVFLWDVGTGRFIRKLRGHDSTINAVTYAANDDVLVTAGYDQCVKLWDMKSRSTEAMQTMKAFRDSVTSVLVHGWEIIAGSVDGTVRRFDVRMGRVYTDELHHPVTSVAASHDGLCVLAACLDSTLRLLDKSTGELLSTYTGHVHSSVKMDCCLTPTDAHVVGCSETGEVVFWDLVESEIVRCFKAHQGVVCSMAMHPEGTSLVTSSLDGLVKVW